MLQARTDEKKKDGEKGWSVWGYVKKFYGIVMMLALLKMILFPGALPEMPAMVQDPTNLKDLKKLNLTKTEMDLIMQAPTIEEKKVEVQKLVATKNKEKDLE